MGRGEYIFWFCVEMMGEGDGGRGVHEVGKIISVGREGREGRY